MAPPPPSCRTKDLSDRPLVDYFWIAGLDTQELLDTFKTAPPEWHLSHTHPVNSPTHRNITDTITEDRAAEQESSLAVSTPGTSTPHRRHDSYQRLSKLSADARSSIQTIDKLRTISVARSDIITIRRVASSNQTTSRAQSPDPVTPVNSATSRRMSRQMEPYPDFDDILHKFAQDRDAFCLDMSLKSSDPESEPTRTTPRRTRTQKIVAEDLDSPTSPARGLSMRRHLSFRDPNSVKRHSLMARKPSTRAPRRVSGYNSVMPMPQPLPAATDEHPLKRSFAPALLDRFPRSASNTVPQQRGVFPNFVPMFAFPNDVHIVSADTRPPSTWHEFSLTGGDNAKTPAVCVVVWIPLEASIANALEKDCEAWRRAHMSEAERELAASLGERLAVERQKLSRLLAMLPSAEFGTDLRLELEDEISTVEEKISLMSDMLRPLRHAAASRIEGLTDGGTGFWIPRAYGILGRDQFMVPFWKEWLKAVVVPMMDGAIVNVPATSPRVGMWQPLERYVSAICNEAWLPMNSKVQVEAGIRELRLYARKEAANELPGSRSTDLYPLFRCLTVPNIVTLFEYVLAEARIILLSSHSSLLKTVSNALLTLIWPLEWSGVYIPVLPSRLVQVLEAPMPYICGVVRGSGILPTPEDNDFVLVDLDCNEIHATNHPPTFPRQQKKKLLSLLYLASPLHHTRGVTPGPPAYICNTFPNDMFVSEHSALYSPAVVSTNLAKLATLNSTQFGASAARHDAKRAPLLNVFQYTAPGTAVSMDRSQTGRFTCHSSQADSDQLSPVNTGVPQPPITPQSKNDSGYAIHASLREKRSGYFDSFARGREQSLPSMQRKASLPFVRHGANPSQTSNAPYANGSAYAPSVYAQSTVAASTVMPGISYQAVRNTTTETWSEGHHLEWRNQSPQLPCTVCGERGEDGYYRCADCPLTAHARCTAAICLPCHAAFYPDQIRAAFARFFASLFQSHSRFFRPANAQQRQLGMVMKFDVDAWVRALPADHGDYIGVLKETQSFDVFVHERETQKTPSSSMALFDALVAARKSRAKSVRSSIAMSFSGRNPFAGKPTAGGVPANYLSDTVDHVWRVVSTSHRSDKADLGDNAGDREYSKIVSRTPARLEDELFYPPSPDHQDGSPLSNKQSLRRRMNGLSMHAP